MTGEGSKGAIKNAVTEPYTENTNPCLPCLQGPLVDDTLRKVVREVRISDDYGNIRNPFPVAVAIAQDLMLHQPKGFVGVGLLSLQIDALNYINNPISIAMASQVDRDVGILGVADDTNTVAIPRQVGVLQKGPYKHGNLMPRLSSAVINTAIEQNKNISPLVITK